MLELKHAVTKAYAEVTGLKTCLAVVSRNVNVQCDATQQMMRHFPNWRDVPAGGPSCP